MWYVMISGVLEITAIEQRTDDGNQNHSNSVPSAQNKPTKKESKLPIIHPKRRLVSQNHHKMERI